jgi:hypothetical protein
MVTPSTVANGCGANVPDDRVAGSLGPHSARRRKSSSLCCWPMLIQRSAVPKPQPAASWLAWLQAQTWTLPPPQRWWCLLASWTWPSRCSRLHRAARGNDYHSSTKEFSLTDSWLYHAAACQPFMCRQQG